MWPVYVLLIITTAFMWVLVWRLRHMSKRFENCRNALADYLGAQDSDEQRKSLHLLVTNINYHDGDFAEWTKKLYIEKSLNYWNLVEKDSKNT